MAWWDSVASLTPVAAWDALHFSGGQLQDQVGGNAITVQGGVATPYPLYGLYGQDKPWPLATPMALSGDFVLMGFVMHVSRGLVFYKALADSNSYFLDQESNGAIYQYANGSGGQVGSGPAWSTPKFMALVVSPASARAYINNDWAGAAFARAWVADTVGGIGYYADGNEYNIGGSERFFAAGLWSGTASLADLRALETACRAALAGPPVGVHAAALSHLHSPSSDQWNVPGSHPRQYRGVASAHRNIPFGGAGVITGTVKEKGQPDQPLVRQVLLYSENTHTLVADVWSDAAGNYRFEWLDPAQRYTVISTDYKQMYTVTPDFVLPVDAVARESLRWLEKPAYNRVFVSGQDIGVLGQITRAGSAGDVLAPMVVDALITEAAAARQRGIAVLADTGQQIEVSLRLPVLAETGIIEPGAFVEYQDGSVTRLGLVRSTQVEAGMPEVWQTLGVWLGVQSHA